MHPGTRDVSAGLLTQFLTWIDQKPRTYAETMEAWRTSCPRISVWEDALLEGLVEMTATETSPQGAARVALTQAGKRHLSASHASDRAPPPQSRRQAA